VRCAGTGTWRLRIAATCRRCHGAPDGRNCNLRLEVRIGLITSSQVERPRKPACAPRSSASAKTTIPRRPRQLGEHRSVDLPRRHASDDRTAWEKHRLHEDLLSRRTNQRAAITSTHARGDSAQQASTPRLRWEASIQSSPTIVYVAGLRLNFRRDDGSTIRTGARGPFRPRRSCVLEGPIGRAATMSARNASALGKRMIRVMV